MKKIFSLLLICCCHLTIASAQTIKHPWQGKKIGYIGDSITDPRNRASSTHYWQLLSEWLGSTAYVTAVSGRQWNDVDAQTDKLYAEHGDSIDAIIIFMGTNDFNKSIPIGEWYAEKMDSVEGARDGKVRHKQLRRHREMVYTDDTFRGRINIGMHHLREVYPDKQIVILTPIHRALFDRNEKNVQPAEDWSNDGGIFLDEYVKSVKEIADVWSVPVIDLASISNLYPLMPQHAKYFNDPKTDLLHPNDAGQKRMALTLYYQLATIPVF